jgi:septal ring factor EnvC (AmiA/AmiB activator)
MTPTQALALALCAASLMLAPAVARAQGTTGTEQQIDTLERQIELSRETQERIAAEVAEAQREQDEVSARLVAISASLQELEAAITASEAELQRLIEERVLILASLGEKQDILSELLAGLQRLEQNPPPALVVEPHDVLAALRGAMLFGTVVPELREEAAQLAAELSRLDVLTSTIKARKQTLSDDMTRMERARVELAGLIGLKQDMVSRGNADLGQERRRADDLARKASSLRQLLANLAEERRKAEAGQARKAAAEEQERLRQEALKRQPRMVFAEARGRLPYPAQGEVMRRFGEPDGLGGRFEGLAIATRQGAQVTAPADGTIEFAGAFRSYGQVVILNPGGGYRILIAGMDEITAGTGESLRAGEPLGRMGRGPSSVTLLGDVVQSGRPVLYIEFRNSTDAIDSDPWWIGGMKEARG